MYKQIAPLDEQETIINIDYEDRKLIIYTTKASVMNRMEKKGYEPVRVDKVDGEIIGVSYEFTTKDIGKFLRTGIFGYNAEISQESGSLNNGEI